MMLGEIIIGVLCVIALVYILRPKNKNEFDFLKEKGDWLVYNIPFNRPSGCKVFMRDVSLKGTQHYIETFKKMLKSKKFEISFAFEDNNKYDKNAIVAKWKYKNIGYIPREIAYEIAQNKLNDKLVFVPIALGLKIDKKYCFMRFDIYIKK